MRRLRMILSAMTAVTLVVFLTSFHSEEAQAQPGPCAAPDNGTGTATLPADCPYTSPLEKLLIIDGLPPGTTIEIPFLLDDFLNVLEGAGGTLGGTRSTADATLYLYNMKGTGSLAGYTRSIAMPVSAEIHWAPRTPGDPVQTFAADWYRLQGSIVGDPDFDSLTFTAGTDYGLPSPGQTTLTELPSGDFNVDSFFDITYQIAFVGAPGSVLDGYAGTTTGTIRIVQGVSLPSVGGIAELPLGAADTSAEGAPAPSDGSGLSTGTWVAVATGAAAVVLVLAGGSLYVRRRRVK